MTSSYIFWFEIILHVFLTALYQSSNQSSKHFFEPSHTKLIYIYKTGRQISWNYFLHFVPPSSSVASLLGINKEYTEGFTPSLQILGRFFSFYFNIQTFPYLKLGMWEKLEKICENRVTSSICINIFYNFYYFYFYLF